MSPSLPTPADELISAVKANNIAAAARLIDQHTELRSQLNDPLPGLPFDSTILHAAVDSRNREMVDLLLRSGADINATTHWWAGGFGVLDLCAPEFADFLIDRGATLTTNAAARLGRLADVERLVRGDPGLVHARGGDGQTPLHVAATAEIARVLVEQGADIDALDVDHESTPAQYAVRDRQDVARYLVALGCRTDILMASALGDLARVREFLDADGESINTSVNDVFYPMRSPRAGGTIYIWTLGSNKIAHDVARDFGHDDVLQLLRSRTPDSLAFALACERGDTVAVEELSAARPGLSATLSEQERRRLVVAAENNNTQGVELMLETGWPVDVRGTHGESALHWAAWHGNANLTRVILRHRPSLEVRDGRYDGSPLAWALHGSRNGWHRDAGDYATTVEALIAAGATVPGDADAVASTSVLTVLRRHGFNDGQL